MSSLAKNQRQREDRLAHARQRQQRPEHGLFSRHWKTWHNATLEVELADEPAFVAKLHDVKNDMATLHQIDPRNGELLGVRTIDWPPDGKVTVIRTPSGTGQHMSAGARGNFS